MARSGRTWVAVQLGASELMRMLGRAEAVRRMERPRANPRTPDFAVALGVLASHHRFLDSHIFGSWFVDDLDFGGKESRERKECLQ